MLHDVACPLGAEWTIEIGSSPRFGFAASQNLRNQLDTCVIFNSAGTCTLTSFCFGIKMFCNVQHAQWYQLLKRNNKSVYEKSTTRTMISDQKQWRGEWRMTSNDFEWINSGKIASWTLGKQARCIMWCERFALLHSIGLADKMKEESEFQFWCESVCINFEQRKKPDERQIPGRNFQN